MLVCHCNVVTDGQIRTAILAGARDLDSVASVCGAGADCAGCHPTVAELLDDAWTAIMDPSVIRDRQARRWSRRVVPAA